MSIEEFNQYLRSPALLAELDDSVLSALSERYPFSPNVRLLQLLRARVLGDAANDEALLAAAAAATCDRGHLYDLLSDLERQDTFDSLDLPAGEILELRELDDLISAGEPAPAEESLREDFRNLHHETPFSLDARATASEQELETKTEAEVTTELPEIFFSSDLSLEVPPAPATDEVADAAPEINFTTSPLTPPATFTPPGLSDWAMGATALLGALPRPTPAPHTAKAEQPHAPAPEEPNRFTPGPSADLRQRLHRLRRRHAHGRSNRHPTISSVARRSLLETDGLASETRAGLLVRQGQYEKAIRMYEHLALANPAKKAIFAGLIDEIKEKL